MRNRAFVQSSTGKKPQLTDRWWPAARLGPLDSWETFGLGPGPVTDDSSSSHIWQLASAKSYGGRLDLCQQRSRRPSIRLLFSSRTRWQPERGGERCWVTAPNLNHKVGREILIATKPKGAIKRQHVWHIFEKFIFFFFLSENVRVQNLSFPAVALW